MKRRNFMKWLGIAPILGVLGIKIPWPKTKPMMFGIYEGFTLHSHKEPLIPYEDTIIPAQDKNAIYSIKTK